MTRGFVWKGPWARVALALALVAGCAGLLIPEDGSGTPVEKVVVGPEPAAPGGARSAVVYTPTFSPVGATYGGAQSVVIVAAGATIYYTANGSTPSTASTKYTGPIAVGVSQTIRAIAVVGNETSGVGTAVYTIDPTAQPVTFTSTELLSRPTDKSVTVSVVTPMAIEAYFEYGPGPGLYLGRTTIAAAAVNTVVQGEITGLARDTQYFYRLVYRRQGTTAWITRPEYTFHTARDTGDTFTFVITSDSHVNVQLGNEALFQRTLTNLLGDKADFLLDLGDTFAMDNVTAAAQADAAYLYGRTNFQVAGHSTPVLLVLGNHEQEEHWHLDDFGGPEKGLPTIGANARKKYFPGPVPNSFYTGNPEKSSLLTGDGLREDYFAFEWGDALFVAIDPYWYTLNKPFEGNLGGGESSKPGTGDRWDWTLGAAQYQWLKTTLETSAAKYKFVFDHNGTGGGDDYGHPSGANDALIAEWGGRNEDGKANAYATRRPGWPKTTHQLLVDNQVSVYFHGHDHQYAYEILDGVVYHSVPMAASTDYANGFGYYSESDPYTLRALPNSGHLRVTVSPTETKVEYVRASVPGGGGGRGGGGGNNGGTNGAVAHTYTVAPGVPAVAAPPVFSLEQGSYVGAQTVAMSSATTGAAIRYTIDGSKPGPTSLLYSGPISVGGSLTVKAVAIKNGIAESAVVSATYTVTNRRRR